MKVLLTRFPTLCAQYEQGQGVEEQDPRRLLARRLRALRVDTWPDRGLTQTDVARALGVSTALISSWESDSRPKIPPLSRIDSYAIVFASIRSFEGEALGAPSPSSLNADEMLASTTLRNELRQLRNLAQQAESAKPASVELAGSTDFWHFEGGTTATIVCAQLPQYMLDKTPYANVDDPDFIELLTYSDLDALFELNGRIRETNPGREVFLRNAKTLTPDDYSEHMVVLGGTDWNLATREFLNRLALPIRQVADWSVEGGQYYEVNHGGTLARHRPVLERAGDAKVLREDVAMFARAVNPFNGKRTVTICNGMYGRGTYGAVRALTHSAFRAANTQWLRSRFEDREAFCLVTRVTVVDGKTLTPDWAAGEHILFEWSR